jgi:ubiquinone biosynthesis protein COQ4
MLTVNDVTVTSGAMVTATDTSGVNNRPIEWRAAGAALLTLAGDTSRTDQVFTIISALTGNSFERTFQAFRRTEHGKRLLEQRPSLMALLEDEARLRSLPEGSLGRAYLDFMERGRLTPGGLVDAQTNGRDPNEALELDEERRYVADRLRDMHDLWHVLTDYGCDDTGEIANLWFSVGQFGNPGMAFIAFFGTVTGSLDARLGWFRFCHRAYLRGRRAGRLVSAPIEEMLGLPLEEARRRLGIAPTEALHPEGIRYGYRRDGKLGALPS